MTSSDQSGLNDGLPRWQSSRNCDGHQVITDITYYAKPHTLVKAIPSQVKLVSNNDLHRSKASGECAEEAERSGSSDNGEIHSRTARKPGRILVPPSIISTRWKMAGGDAIRRIRNEKVEHKEAGGEEAMKILRVKPFQKQLPVPPNCNTFRTELAEPLKESLRERADIVIRKPLKPANFWTDEESSSIQLYKHSMGYMYEDTIGDAKDLTVNALLSRDDAKTVDRATWLSRALRNNESIEELMDRLHPLNRAIRLCQLYHNGGETDHTVVRITDDEMVRLVMQHFAHEGLKDSRCALEQEFGTEYRPINVEGSLLHEHVKDAVKKSEHLYDLVLNTTGKYGTEEQRQDAIRHHTLSVIGFSSHADEKKEEKRLSLIMTSSISPESERQQAERISIWMEDDKNNTILKPGSSNRRVSACSLNALVRRLSDSFYPLNNMRSYEKNLLDVICETFETFTTSRTLLLKLIERFNVPESERRHRKAIQMMVFGIFKYLLQNYYEKFCNADIEMLLHFLDTCELPQELQQLPSWEERIRNLTDEDSSANSEDRDGRQVVRTFSAFADYLNVNDLKQIIEDKLSSEEVNERKRILARGNFPKNATPRPEIPKNIFDENLSLWDVSSLELARQLTIINHEFFVRIRTSEMLNLAWSKPNLKHRSQNLLRMVRHFNETSRWAAHSILEPSAFAGRIARVKLLLGVCQHLKHMYNFDTMQAILSGMRHGALIRMKNLWKSLDKSTKKQMETLRNCISSEGNYTTYRTMIQGIVDDESGRPCIPYMGIYLSDLTFIDEGNDDFVQNPRFVPRENQDQDSSTEKRPIIHEMLINIEKEEMTYSVLRRIKQLQARYFPFLKIPQIHVLCLRLVDEGITDDSLTELSLMREPKRTTT